MNPFFLVLIILGAAVASVAFWCGVVALIGLMGWRQIAGSYRTEDWPEETEGIPFSMQSGYVGVSRYNGVLDGAITEEGLYLRPMKIFSINHPPLFIPWVAMGEPEQRFLTGLRVPLASGHSISFRGALGQRIAAALAAAHAAPVPTAEDTVLDDGLALDDWTGEENTPESDTVTPTRTGTQTG